MFSLNSLSSSYKLQIPFIYFNLKNNILYYSIVSMIKSLILNPIKKHFIYNENLSKKSTFINKLEKILQ